MQSFGERLRQERETRNTTIEEIAAATGIHRGFLEALEKNEFQSLPGRAFGKFYLRAYAEILDFDPEPLMVHYDRERHRDLPEPMERPPDEPTLRRVEASLAKWRASKTGSLRVAAPATEPLEPEPEVAASIDDIELAPPATEPIDAEPEVEAPAEWNAPADDIELAPPATEPVEAEPEASTDDIELALPATEPIEAVPEVEAPAEWNASTDDIELPRKQPRSAQKIAAAVGGVGLLVALYLAFRPSPPPPAPPAATATVPEVAVSVPEPVPPPVKPAPTAPTAPTARTSKPAAAPASPLTISEFGVGRKDEAARVEVPADPFREGDVVAFSTRVRGGRAGQSIRHVWLHRGRAVQSIRLRVGAADWRTHSTKTLWGAGPWSVEARDEAGNVLARAAFECARR
jgi:cytoskeletal protein RodZ